MCVDGTVNIIRLGKNNKNITFWINVVYNASYNVYTMGNYTN